MTPGQRSIKRLFDLAGSACAILLLWPLILVLAILVRTTSPGPALFRHRRVGRNGKVFEVIKLRTMAADGSGAGPQVTADGDPRITPLGRRLRKLKLDELPQFWNVLRGQMSLVGPRPDVEGYADRLRGPAARLLEIRPGITGPATLYFRDEEAMLAEAGDLIDHYDRVIYPQKIKMDLEYIEDWSLMRDVGLLLVTILPFTDRWLRVIPVDRDVSTGTD